MRTTVSNIFNLGIKEFRSVYRDPAMLVLLPFAFTFQIYFAAHAQPETLQNASIAVVDEDHTTLSARILDSLRSPYFMKPPITSQQEATVGMDNGIYSFSLDIPPNFERDVAAGRNPAIQLNVDATLVSQAFIGAGNLQEILDGDVKDFEQHYRSIAIAPAELDTRILFNPNLNKSWFAGLMEVINTVSLMAIILTGAAMIREREHGTIEHLLVMPLTPFEIMASKTWSMGLLVLVAAIFSLQVMVREVIGARMIGSVPLFVVGMSLNLIATTSLGIFLGTVARSMPQFGLLAILCILPMQILSGSVTPAASMPLILQKIMLISPTTHFVNIAEAILLRGAGLHAVWPRFLSLVVIAAVFFIAALVRFRNSIGTMQT